MEGPHLALALALAAALWAVATPCVRAAELGVVYVRANVGGASGGHAALVAGRTVYHVQSTEDGLAQLVRGTWAHFRYVYADLENRTLSLAELEIPDDAQERVLAHLSRAWVEQELGLARREALRADAAWLGAQVAGQPLPELAFAGLVDPARGGDADAAALRQAVAARLGSGVLEARRAAAERALAEREPARAGESLEPLREQLVLREALAALVEARGLAPEALVVLPGEFDDPLTAEERVGLEAFAAELAGSVASLVDSPRPDRGQALLVAQARHLAVRRSLAENRLRVLDPFSEVLEPSGVDPIGPGARAALIAHAGSLLREGRGVVLAAARADEPAYNLLEEAAGVLERVSSAREGDALRDLGRMRVPARARAVASPPPAAEPEGALAATRAALAEHEARLRERAGYDLFRRNCITELVRATNEPFDSPEQVTAAFGGRIEPDELLGFVPFVFFDAVTDRLRVRRVVELPSYRLRELERLRREQPGLATRLRESSPLTSRIYTPVARDGAFLLFSDDVFWRRPVYGLFNLAWAVGYTAYGVAAAPFDRGARASAGLRGAMWSVPELVFGNVRKGSFDWVDAPREPRVP